jgi:hypothetical protein
VLAIIFFHRRGAEDAENVYFLFAVERTANKRLKPCGQIAYLIVNSFGFDFILFVL